MAVYNPNSNDGQNLTSSFKEAGKSINIGDINLVLQVGGEVSGFEGCCGVSNGMIGCSQVLDCINIEGGDYISVTGAGTPSNPIIITGDEQAAGFSIQAGTNVSFTGDGNPFIINATDNYVISAGMDLDGNLLLTHNDGAPGVVGNINAGFDLINGVNTSVSGSGTVNDPWQVDATGTTNVSLNADSDGNFSITDSATNTISNNISNLISVTAGANINLSGTGTLNDPYVIVGTGVGSNNYVEGGSLDISNKEIQLAYNVDPGGTSAIDISEAITNVNTTPFANVAAIPNNTVGTVAGVAYFRDSEGDVLQLGGSIPIIPLENSTVSGAAAWAADPQTTNYSHPNCPNFAVGGDPYNDELTACMMAFEVANGGTAAIFAWDDKFVGYTDGQNVITKFKHVQEQWTVTTSGGASQTSSDWDLDLAYTGPLTINNPVTLGNNKRPTKAQIITAINTVLGGGPANPGDWIVDGDGTKIGKIYEDQIELENCCADAFVKVVSEPSNQIQITDTSCGPYNSLEYTITFFDTSTQTVLNPTFGGDTLVILSQSYLNVDFIEGECSYL